MLSPKAIKVLKKVDSMTLMHHTSTFMASTHMNGHARDTSIQSNGVTSMQSRSSTTKPDTKVSGIMLLSLEKRFVSGVSLTYWAHIKEAKSGWIFWFVGHISWQLVYWRILYFVIASPIFFCCSWTNGWFSIGNFISSSKIEIYMLQIHCLC